MKLSDEQLAEWAAKQAGTQSGDVLVELLAARKVVEAARNSPCRHSADTDGRTCLVCKAITAYDKATK